MEIDQREMLGAFRALNMPASPRLDGSGITFGCPKCSLGRLAVNCEAVECPECHWRARGAAWEIAQLAAAARPKELAGNLPPIIGGSEIISRQIVLPDELIAGMLHRGSKMVLGGGSKSFKTWCLLDLAISISAGRHWWGREIRQGSVVYLNLEVQSAFFEARIQSIARAKGCSITDALGIWNLRGHCADHRLLLPELALRLAERQLAAIILDPTYKVMGGSENAQEEVAALMDSIEKLAARTGAAVIFGSHFAKGNAAAKDSIDRISGSGVFARDPDAILTMTKHEDEGVFVVDPILRNCPPIEPFCVKWEFPLMRPANDADPAKLKVIGGPKRFGISDAMACLPYSTVTKAQWVVLMKEKKDIGKSRAYELIEALENAKPRDLVFGSGLYKREVL